MKIRKEVSKRLFTDLIQEGKSLAFPLLLIAYLNLEDNLYWVILQSGAVVEEAL